MSEAFFIRALIAGTGVALVAGVMGCFVVWRRMAYFGDSLAHSAILGIAFGLASGIGVLPGALIVCALFAVMLVSLQQTRILPADTLLGILAHAALSFGLITISLTGLRIDLYGYLFGDILTVTLSEIAWIYCAAAVVLAVIVYNWSALVLMTLNVDLARAENARTVFLQFLFVLLMTVVVAVSVRIVGILLVTSMLIIPGATARQVVRTPEAMAFAAAIFGVLAVFSGLYGSLYFDTPAGPGIVAGAALIFVLVLFLSVMVQTARTRKR